jgi:hypothetical protein
MPAVSTAGTTQHRSLDDKSDERPQRFVGMRVLCARRTNSRTESTRCELRAVPGPEDPAKEALPLVPSKQGATSTWRSCEMPSTDEDDC